MQTVSSIEDSQDIGELAVESTKNNMEEDQKTKAPRNKVYLPNDTVISKSAVAFHGNFCPII